MGVKPGYKRTEVGVIPEEWECRAIGDLAAPIANAIVGGPFGSDLVSADYVYDGIPVIRGQNMGSRYLEGPYVYVSRAKANSLAANLARPGDVVFTQRGTLGQVSLTPKEPFDHYLVSQSQMKVTLHHDRVTPDFLLSWFESSEGQQSIASSAIQTGVPHINLGILKALTVPVPPVHEQRAIATALSDVDALLTQLDRLIAKKCDIKQAAMQQLLTGKTRLPGFAEEWQVRRLGEHVTFLRNGVHSRAELTAEGSVKYLHYGDIHTSPRVRLDPLVTAMPCLPAHKAATLDRLRTGDLVFADASEDMDGVGKSVEIGTIEDGSGLVSGLHTIAARFDRSILADGFKAYLQFCPAFRSQLYRLAAGTKVYATTSNHIASIEIALPCVAEQTAIATLLSDLDAELAALEARRDKTRALKQGMMQELLTGRTRLV